MSELSGSSMRSLTIPRRSLVLLVGPSGSGKSTFARAHFTPYQIVESDHCRGLVCDDEADQDATQAAFDLLHFLVEKRLEFGKLTVVDATNVEARSRKPLLALAREHRFPFLAIVFDIGEDAALRHNALRPDRQVPTEAVQRHHQELRLARKELPREGFSRVYVLKSPEEIDAARVVVE
jgi:protein phosphatase